MRAAEASVSSVPTPMKILPIRELWSQAVLGWLLAITGAGRGCASVAATTAFCAGGLSCCRARSRSLSWSGATTWFSAPGAARYYRPLPVRCRWRGRSARWPRRRSACRRRRAARWHWRRPAASGSRPGRHCRPECLPWPRRPAARRPSCRPCRRISAPSCCWRGGATTWRRCLLGLTASACLLALSGFELALELGAACTAAPNSRNSPARTINAARPLAFIMLTISPIHPSRERTETPAHDDSGAKNGNLRARPGKTGANWSAAPAQPGAGRTDRCYEPSRVLAAASDARASRRSRLRDRADAGVTN